MPGRYLIFPDQALPNCVWAPPSSAEGGKSSKMRYRPGKFNIRKYPDQSGYFSYMDEQIIRWPKRL